MTYTPVFTENDIPEPPYNKRKLNLLTLIQIDEALLESTVILRAGRRVAAVTLEGGMYGQFIRELNKLNDSYRRAHMHIAAMRYLFPYSLEAPVSYIAAPDREGLKNIFKDNCETLESSVKFTLSKSAGVFRTYKLHHYSVSLTEQKEIILRGIHELREDEGKNFS